MHAIGPRLRTNRSAFRIPAGSTSETGQLPTVLHLEAVIRLRLIPPDEMSASRPSSPFTLLDAAPQT
jgi:hypothetical protein